MFLLELIILLKNVKTYCPIYYKLGVIHKFSLLDINDNYVKWIDYFNKGVDYYI